MTRKDYELLAGAISRTCTIPQADYKLPFVKGRMEQFRNTARSVADALADDNPRFDRERFLKACGVE